MIRFIAIILGLLALFFIIVLAANFIPNFQTASIEIEKPPMPVVEGDKISSQSKSSGYKPSVKLPATSMSLEAIAGRLLGEYLEHYMLDEQPEAERLSDYKIDQVKFIKSDKDSYDTEVIFSVQSVIRDSNWMAGNGVQKENNWIKDKMVFVHVSIEDDIYTLESFGTGP